MYQRSKNLFWEQGVKDIQNHRLTECGILTEKFILNIHTHYPAVTLDNYVIMPDHVHLLLQIHSDENGRPMVAPTVATIVQQLKGCISKQIGNSIWQKGFYDRVIRTDAEYREVWKYIDDNPRKLLEQK